MKKNWYAVYTKARCEKKVSAWLTKKKIENYCPLNKVPRLGTYDYRNGVYEPLIPNFVFVHISENDMQAIRQQNDVVNFVYWLGRPAKIHEREIESIQEFMNEFEHVQLEKTPVNNQGMVRILTNTGYETNGNLVSLTNNKVKVTLPSLGYALPAEVKKASVDMFRYRMQVRDKVS